MVKEILSVVHVGNSYYQSDGIWYDSQTNLKVPITLSHKLDSIYVPRIKKRPNKKFPTAQVERPPRKNWFIFSGGLPGLGK